ncbi:hypothetical protein Efla_000434 [Eimeria flavescens]
MALDHEGGGAPRQEDASVALLAVCCLNQWALDFEGNFRRIAESIRIAKRRGAKFRVGPELETCGYGCEDHFLENDTEMHAWEVIAKLVDSDLTDGILVELGAPVFFEGSQYNCRVLLLNRRVLLVRPKCVLVDEGGYRESRYFAAWSVHRGLQELQLPAAVSKLTGQLTAPIGVALLRCRDSLLGFECCEELWGPQPPHASAYLSGADVVSNGSSSYYQKGKHARRVALLLEATRKHGGLYLYSNQVGGDGGRVVFDGGALASLNGELLQQGPRFFLREVDVLLVAADLQTVRAYRRANPTISRAAAAASQRQLLPLLHADICLSAAPQQPQLLLPLPAAAGSCLDTRVASPAAAAAAAGSLHAEEEETAAAAALWLWDYLRRSRARGYFVALSGGADSAAVLLLLAFMCHSIMLAVQPALAAAAAAAAQQEEEEEEGTTEMIESPAEANSAPAAAAAAAAARTAAVAAAAAARTPAAAAAAAGAAAAAAAADAEEVLNGSRQVLQELECILGLSAATAEFPRDSRALSHLLLHTCYMGSEHSSSRTRELSTRAADELGAYHVAARIDGIASSFLSAFKEVTGWQPQFQQQGGTAEEDVALQNVQARSRMVLSYMLAQLLPAWRLRSLEGAPTKGPPRKAGGVGGGRPPRRGGGGPLLVVGTGNADETLAGYLTKYDCSSADINPIGSLRKRDINALLTWAATEPPFAAPVFAEILSQPPSAELRPRRAGEEQQTDEQEMGLTYEQLSLFGDMRRSLRCGPLTLLRGLLLQPALNFSPIDICRQGFCL